MPNASISIQVLPNVPDDRLFAVVDRVIEAIAQTGLTYAVGPFDTTVEGDLDELLALVKTAQQICMDNGSRSVFTNIKLAYDPEGVATIAQKVAKHRH